MEGLLGARARLAPGQLGAGGSRQSVLPFQCGLHGTLKKSPVNSTNFIGESEHGSYRQCKKCILAGFWLVWACFWLVLAVVYGMSLNVL